MAIASAAKRGYIPSNQVQVRSPTLHIPVNSGATTLCLPADAIAQLEIANNQLCCGALRGESSLLVFALS